MHESDSSSSLDRMEFDHDDLPQPFIAPHNAHQSKCSKLQSILQDCIFEKGTFSYCYDDFDSYQKCVQAERKRREEEEMEKRYQAYLKEEKEEKEKTVSS